jgi:hypothetical protein
MKRNFLYRCCAQTPFPVADIWQVFTVLLYWQSVAESWRRAEVPLEDQRFQPRQPLRQADFLPAAFAVHA